LALLLAGNAAMAQEVGVAARVNGVEIPVFRLERYFQDYLQEKGRNVGEIRSPQVYKNLKREALEGLIEVELLWQEAQKKNLIAAPEEVRAAMEQLRTRFQSKEALQRKLEVAGFTEETYLDYLKRALSARRYRERELAAAKVSDEAVHEFYAGNPDKFIRPEAVGARHILIKADAQAGQAERAKAKQRIGEILAEAKKGADFAGLAKKHSEDATAVTGGDLGYFPRGRMVKAFEDAAFALKPGEISEVVETVFGYHVIKLQSREPGGVVPEAEAREQVREYLLAAKRAQAVKDALERLRSNAVIEILTPL
jgi:peptidyl-prolyl cis-trans isomerase C